MRVTASDAVAILRRYKLVDEEARPREVDQIKMTHPSPYNLLVSFRFRRQRFHALFDSSAKDDLSVIINEIRKIHSDIQGEIIAGPNEQGPAYGLPFKGKDVYLYEEISPKTRLDLLLSSRHPELSRSSWQKHIREGRITVNETVVTLPRFETAETDRVEIRLPAEKDTSNLLLPVLYIDDDVVVINKPAGILTHAKGAMKEEFTAADFFRRYTDYKSDTNRPGVIHRLDRATSGVLLGARNETAAVFLQKQFSDRKVKKTYLAVLERPPKAPAALIDLPIGRHATSPGTFRVDPKGKSARTLYKILAVNADGQALVQLQPETGRTHQLRVHMAYIDSPIVGDQLYGHESAERMFLHAFNLEITLPSRQRRIFTADIPEEFRALFPGEKVTWE